jgi:hypothetical protein
MPQFDSITFFNQIFWFLIVFLSFYFIVLKNLLPVLATTLKTRKKLINYILSVGSAKIDNLLTKSSVKNVHANFKSCKNFYFSLDKDKLTLFETKKRNSFFGSVN